MNKTKAEREAERRTANWAKEVNILVAAAEAKWAEARQERQAGRK